MSAPMGVPLGRVEDERLELKGRAALERPETIARAVVAMLNADGGEVWIGIREEGGRAMQIEPIEDAESAKDRLWDFLVDSLEPALLRGEVRIEVVDLDEGGEGVGGLLRVDVAPRNGRRPYALVRGSAWHFLIRVGARLHPMSREEIVGKPGSDHAADGDVLADDLNAARATLSAWRDRQPNGSEGLWLGAVTVPELALDLQLPLFEELAFEPTASGNRTTGWNFVRTQQQPALHSDRIEWGGASEDYAIRVELFEDGRAMFMASFGALAWKDEDIWPLALLEYPISAFRILSRIYREQAGKDFRVVADLALFEVGDRGLKPGSPGSFRFGTQPRRRLTEGQDVFLERPLEFSRIEVVEEPDRCGFRLLRRIYQAFGMREEDIPAEYDRKTGRLVLPE